MERPRSINRVLSATFGLVAVGALLTTSATDAEAAFALRLTSDGATVTVNDTDGDGAVFFNGALGAFAMNVSSGFGSPLLAGPFPHIDLSTANVSGGPGTITVELSQTGNDNGGPRRLNLHWGPVTQGTSNMMVFVDLDDNLFGQDTTLNATKIFDFTSSGPAESFNDATAVLTNNSYSVTMVWTITHTAAGKVTSGNANLQVPEPGSLALMGMGLIGLGFFWRRRSRLELAA